DRRARRRLWAQVRPCPSSGSIGLTVTRLRADRRLDLGSAELARLQALGVLVAVGGLLQGVLQLAGALAKLAQPSPDLTRHLGQPLGPEDQEAHEHDDDDFPHAEAEHDGY